ncbi:MAG: hypothetical protein JWS10_3320 [Cypionkella sp.]|nr:hypothetical protein [Cypionkella sp.]
MRYGMHGPKGVFPIAKESFNFVAHLDEDRDATTAFISEHNL